MHPLEQAAKRMRLAQAELLEPMLKRALRLPGEAAMNDQRMVDVWTINQLQEVCDSVGLALQANKLRAIISGPGVEPAGFFYEWDTPLGLYRSFTYRERNGNLPTRTVAYYLAAPSAPSAKCAECGKQASEGWALYCVECAEKVAPVQAVPDGWQLVPKEPTEEMVQALKDGSDTGDDGEDSKRTVYDCIRLEYKAMLAAAPQPPKEIGE